MPKLYGILKNPNNPRNLEDARMLKAFIEIKMPGFKSGGRIGLKDGTDKSMLEKFLDSKLVQEGRYGASEFFFGDPICLVHQINLKMVKIIIEVLLNVIQVSIGKLSPEKQAYIEAFLNSEKDNYF
jgi:hypothetical protein